MQALKRELSLDLNTVGGGAVSKLSTECSSTTLQQQQQRNQNLISPNSNFTDNTSQSITPSEFGYQNLHRQLSMHSLINTEENSPAYEEYENTPSNLNSPLKHLASPIKSTISITYNLKSPQRELFEEEDKARERPNKTPSFLRTKDGNERKISGSKALLETSFDENTVYEQVKFFRNSVTEVNQLLNEDRKYLNNELENLAEIEELSESERESDKELITPIDQHQVDDIQMSDEEKLLYENVELRKPKSVYENLSGESMKQTKNDKHNSYQDREQDQDPEVELDSLDSIKDHEAIETIQISSGGIAARRSPSNFSVKELANKFEASPVEQMPAFDFSTRHSIRKSTPAQQQQQQPLPQPNLNTHPERGLKHHHRQQQQQQQSSKASLKQKLNKTQQITRSLDENAFIREFGNKNLQELKIKSSQQLPELTEEHCSSSSSRRKSFDFTRPKTLNPPKRLPGMPITEEHFNTKTIEKSLLRIDLPKEKNFNTLNTTTSSSLEHDYESTELKITPTTENRISLIQNNVQPPSDNNSQDVNNSNVSKVLSGVKLDRERIDRIKEERRQQLTQKYHSDSFKSKSKSDLNSSSKNDDDDKFISDNTSLRVKSKSRADMRTLQKDMDNLKEFGRNPPSTALSETTLNTGQHRIRSISDEKNQNNYVETNANNTTESTKDNFIKRSTHSQHNLNRSIMTNNTSSSSSDQEEFSARATVQKFERKSMDFVNGVSGVGSGVVNNAPVNSLSRERSRQQEMSSNSTTTTTTTRNSLSSK